MDVHNDAHDDSDDDSFLEWWWWRWWCSMAQEGYVLVELRKCIPGSSLGAARRKIRCLED